MTNFRDFLVDWLAWAEAGGEGLSPAGHAYRKDWGLCTNARRFWDDVMDPMEDWLVADFGDSASPFGMDEYVERQHEGTQHQCPKRLAWVRKTIEELSE